LARLRDAGEKQVLKRLEKLLSMQWLCTSLSPGDDAVCAGEGHEDLLVKIDGGSVASSLAPWMSYADLGWQWVTATASDLVAKAAKPLVFLVSVGLSPEEPEEHLYEIVKGAMEAARRHGAWLGGGDTNGSYGAGWVDVAGIGKAVRLPLPGRRARPSDQVYVTTGRLGLSGIALHSLLHGNWAEAKKSFPEAFSEFTRPLARLGFLELYRALGHECVTASLDISDGLAETLYQLSEATGRVIVLDNLPEISIAAEYARLYRISYSELLLYGGQEYELVFTVSPECKDNVETVSRQVGLEITRIGHVTRIEDVGVKLGNRIVERRGWDNFARA